MPIYEFKCKKCSTVHGRIVKSTVEQMPCPVCTTDRTIQFADRQLSAPARITMADMPTLNRKRQRVKEPLWRYPDGHAESVH